MFKETNRIRLSFLLVFFSACAFHCTAQSETITSGLSVYIPSFEERFDWSFNYGGNDGGSSLERLHPGDTKYLGFCNRNSERREKILLFLVANMAISV